MRGAGLSTGLSAGQNATITGNWTFDGTTGITLKAITAGSVNGIYAGSDTLLRFFTAAAGAGGQSDGKNLFVGGAGNSTMTNGAGAVSLASWNTAIGYGAFAANTTGYFNVALGYNALAANTTGAANIAIGTQALLATTTGYHNTAIGYRALYQNTEGSSNTAFGFNTLQSAQTANFNTAIGDGVLGVCTVSENTGVGYQSLNACSTGAQNVAMGNGAGLLLTQGSTNVLLGYLAGVTGGAYANALTTGSGNVWVGANCGSSTTSQLSNTVVIGANALVGASNTVQIGDSNITDFGFYGSLNQKGASGQVCAVKIATSSQTIAAGGTFTFTNLIPAGAVVLGVTVRVTTAITSGDGGTTFSIGDGTDADRWGTGIAFDLNTTTTGTAFTTTTPHTYAAATSVVLTCNGGTFSGTGVVRVTVHYIAFTAATS